jgi:hypothetical protein
MALGFRLASFRLPRDLAIGKPDKKTRLGRDQPLPPEPDRVSTASRASRSFGSSFNAF